MEQELVIVLDFESVFYYSYYSWCTILGAQRVLFLFSIVTDVPPSVHQEGARSAESQYL